jgi:hypothetical protein
MPDISPRAVASSSKAQGASGVLDWGEVELAGAGCAAVAGGFALAANGTNSRAKTANSVTIRIGFTIRFLLQLMK